MKPAMKFQVDPSTAKREKKTLKYIAMTCLIYITQGGQRDHVKT